MRGGNKVRAWEALYSGGFSETIRRRLPELFDDAGNPKILLREGEPVSGQTDLTINWNGEQITETLQVVEDVDGLSFRFKHMREQGSQYDFPVNGQITHAVIPARVIDNLPSTLRMDDINLMQINVSNHTGNASESFFMLRNAMELQNGTLSVETLGPIRVWENLDPEASGIWTLDHRRLTAYKLAGIDNIPYTLANQNEVVQEFSKMSTQSLGRDCIVRVYINNNTGKFCHPSSVPAIDRRLEQWEFRKISEGNYRVFNQDGAEIDLKNDLPAFLE